MQVQQFVHYRVKILKQKNSSETFISEEPIKFYRYNISHTHTYSYDVLDATYHYVSCECGDIIIEHTFSQQILPLSETNDPDYIPSYTCTYCGYVSSGIGI